MTCTETDPTFHTADTTVWFWLAYSLPFGLWRVIPHRWMTRPCPSFTPTEEAA